MAEKLYEYKDTNQQSLRSRLVCVSLLIQILSDSTRNLLLWLTLEPAEESFILSMNSSSLQFPQVLSELSRSVFHFPSLSLKHHPQFLYQFHDT